MQKLNGWKTACVAGVLCSAAAMALPAQTFRTVLDSDNTNGAFPSTVLLQGPDGSLYGATKEGGGTGPIQVVTPGDMLTSNVNFRVEP